MRFVGIAALLLGSAMPAQAEIMYEINGLADVWTDDYNGNYAHLGLFQFSAFGALDFELNTYGYGPTGFSLESPTGHFNMLSLDLKWRQAPLDNFLDGNFHPVRGQGAGRYGGPDLGAFYGLTINQARLYETPEFEVMFPQFELGAAIPEPATWAMLITGFAMAGAGMRRKVSHYRPT